MRTQSMVVLLAVMAAGLSAQPKLSRDPDVKNASYGPHERNVLDVWRAKSGTPAPLVAYIHGGGFNVVAKVSKQALAQIEPAKP